MHGLMNSCFEFTAETPQVLQGQMEQCITVVPIPNPRAVACGIGSKCLCGTCGGHDGHDGGFRVAASLYH